MALEATIKQLKKKGKPNNGNKSKGNEGKGKNKKGKKGDKDKLPSWMSKEPPRLGQAHDLQQEGMVVVSKPQEVLPL